MEMNRDIDLDPQPPIYALLSDFGYFYFLSYDGANFQYMATITIPPLPRERFLRGKINGMLPRCLELPVSY
jgi:hypothetical protein